MKPRLLHISAIGKTASGLLLPQAQAAQSMGFDVGFIYSPDPPVTSKLRTDGFTVFEVPIARKLSPTQDIRSIGAIKDVMTQWKPDIVHTHTSKGGAVGRAAAILYGKANVVHTIHGFPFIAGQPSLKYWTYLGLEWVMARYMTDVLLSQSREDVRLARRYRLRARYAYPQWIGNGVDLLLFDPRFVPKTTKLRQAHSVPGENKILLTIARIKKEKGLGEVVEALVPLRSLPWSWFIVGGIEEPGFYSRLRERIREVGLEDRVVFLGPRDDIPELLAEADWYILASHREGVPRSLIEAHAMAVPSITTDIRGCNEVCVDAQTGFIVPATQVLPLAAALEQALTGSADEYECMRIKARMRAEANFDENAVIERILDSYRPILTADGKNLTVKPHALDREKRAG
ncbi:MAG TPA: glycosyltransferase family 1 protein [Actinobacteria bacterium]|nr:glycosyltransferase family 1 protein [Actinomycetota bacterium]